MKASLKPLALALTIALPAPAMALSVTASTDGNALASALLSAGSGITISNVSLIGANNQQGSFSGGLLSGIGIDAGIILTSGSIFNAPGPNNLDNATSVTNTGGDSDLANLITGYSINDTNSLQFDFTTSTGDLFFQYVFASEEYNEFVNSLYNDVFGFFLNGVNIALVPNTNTPVSIDTVNCGNNGVSLGQNCSLFNNNDLSDGGPSFNIQYDGFTKVLTASALGLNVNNTYTMKLAIADAGDDHLDSAVFLKAGSFSETNPNNPTVPEPATLALLGLGLAGLGFTRRRRA